MTIWQAASFDAAIGLAEAEAAADAAALSGEYVGFAQAFEADDAPGRLPADDYVDRFFDTGRRAGTEGS